MWRTSSRITLRRIKHFWYKLAQISSSWKPVVSHTSWFAYKLICIHQVVLPTWPWTIRIHRSWFAYIEKRKRNVLMNTLIPGVTNWWNRWSIKIDINRWQSISINQLILIIDDQSLKIFVTLSIGIDWHQLSSIAIDCHRLPLIVIDYHNAVFYYLNMKILKPDMIQFSFQIEEISMPD